MVNFKLILKYAFLDLSKQKVRTILALIGMLISIGLLTAVLFLNDSISAGYVDYLTIEAGNQDAVISVRRYAGEPENSSSYFKFDPLIATIQNKTNSIENFIPRMDITGTVNISAGFNTTSLTGQGTWTTISAINFSLENDIQFGSFINAENNRLLTLDEMETDHCIIYKGFNDIIRYSVNDTIEIMMRLTHGNHTYSLIKNLTIDAIFDFNLKWPREYRNRHLIVIDLNTLYEYFSFVSKYSSDLILTLELSNQLYDIRDIEETRLVIKSIMSDIQIAIGITGFNINLPKLRILGNAETVSVLIVIVFIFSQLVHD